MNNLIIQNLAGMNHRYNMDSINDSEAILLYNVALNKFGAWSKRKGWPYLGSAVTGGDCRTLVNYTTTNTLRRFRTSTGKFEAYNPTTNLWTAFGSVVTPIPNRISSVNFKSRVYHISDNLSLSYENGGALTTVGGAANEIKGKYLAVAQNTLIVANVNSVSGAPVAQQNRFYYSLFDITQKVPGDQLYNYGETMSNSTRVYELESAITGVCTYETTGKCYIFTENAGYEFDIESESLTTKFGVGLASSKAITSCMEMLIWLDKQKKIWAWGGAGAPVNLSINIEEDENKEALMNSINLEDANIDEIAAGSIGNSFWFSVGEAEYKGEVYNNAVIRGVVTQDKGNTMFSVDGFDFRVNNFAECMLSGEKVLVVSTVDNESVYRVGEGLKDGASAINAFCRTKFYNAGSTFTTKRFFGVIVEYKPQPVQDTFLKVKYAINQNVKYTTVSDPASSSALYGAIDMYYPETTQYSDVKVVLLPEEARGRSISFEFGNSVTNQDFEIYSFAILYEDESTDIPLEV